MVERPSFHIWQPLEAEGILWEGQVAIVGGAADMPSLLAVTSQRIVLIADGKIMLDFPRAWLRPEPRLAAENGVRIFINPDGQGSEAHPVLLRARDGRGAAFELISVLTGRPLPSRLPARPAANAKGITIPNWKETVGAARSVALPQIDEEPEVAPKPTQRFWPPQETNGVAPTPATTRREHPTSRPMQSIADRRGGMVDPKPVPTSVSRAARQQGTEKDGVTVRDTDRWQQAHFTSNSRKKRGGVSWLLSVAAMLLLLGGIGYVVQDRYGITMDDLRERVPASIQETLGMSDGDESDVALNTAPETVDEPQDRGSDGTEGTVPEEAAQDDEPAEDAAVIATEEPTMGSSDVNNEPLDPTLGLGGATTALPETEPAEEEQDPADAAADTAAETAVETVAPTEEPVVEPTTEPTIEPTAEPTEEPVVEPTSEPTAEPTVEPTAEPTEEPVVEPTVEPTQEPTAEPTEEVVSTPEPTIEPTAEATEEPAPTSQAPSVEPETTPEQAVVANGFRYTIEGASVGTTVPELPEINSVEGYGSWVVLDVQGQNVSGDVQIFDMADFVLYADGQEVPLDSGNAWVSGLLGNTPAYGPTDAIQWAAGEGHRFTLTFLAPANPSSLILKAGDQMIDIAPAIENPAPLMNDTEMVESDLIEGRVVEVVDGETIVVEIDGVQQTVRYLGLDVPTGDACYASEATEANRALVEGQTVTIERQATDVDARGNWVRDVWITTEDGLPMLVSQQMIAQGAAEANISEPNTRFAGWLQQTEATARDNAEGMWGSCGE